MEVTVGSLVEEKGTGILGGVREVMVSHLVGEEVADTMHHVKILMLTILVLFGNKCFKTVSIYLCNQSSYTLRISEFSSEF